MCYGTPGDDDPYGYAQTEYAIQSAGTSVRNTLSSIGTQSRSDWLARRDISVEHGGNIEGHGSHEFGLDFDYRTMRKDGKQCYSQGAGVTYWSSAYSYGRTRVAFREVWEYSTRLGGDIYKITFFNDPDIEDEWPAEINAYPNHDEHLHTRFCMRAFPYSSYRC